MKREFSLADAVMIENSTVIRNLFLADMADFTAFDTTLDNAYATNWQQLIDDCYDIVSDESYTNQLQQQTSAVTNAMKQAQYVYNSMQYFAGTAFKKNRLKLEEFGLGEYDKSRKSQAKMVVFLEALHKVAVSYQAELITAGCSAPKIAEILTIKGDLEAKNTSQEVKKRKRPEMTDDRIETLNQCYRAMIRVRNAAVLVYPEDAAKKRQYMIYASSPAGNTQYFEGSVNSGETLSFDLEVSYDPNRTFSFSNTGSEPLHFSLSDAPDQLQGNIVPVPAGTDIDKIAIELNTSGTWLVVKNSGAGAGSFECILIE